MNIYPLTLSGRYVQLEPLSTAHVPELASVGLEEGIWRFMRYGPIQSEAQLQRWVLELLALQKSGSDLPFAVIDLAGGRAIGCTRYMDIHYADRWLEIGGTWYGLAYQGTQVNPECKYLLLRHAFEALDCIRVQFKTDSRNTRSQRALDGIGATREGVLRNHMILPDGVIRHSVYYSIIESEWPQVKTRLEERLGYG